MNAPPARPTLEPSQSNDVKATARKRIAVLDVAKGLGILLVVFGHNRWVSDHYYSLDRAIASFRLPFFFFVSGVTFPMLRSIGQVALRRADAMLKPFAVTVLLLGLWQVFRSHSSLEFVALELFYATGFTLSWEPLWFLPHLWLVSVFAATVSRVLGKYFQIWSVRGALLALMLGGGYMVLKFFHNPMQDDLCLHITTFSSRLFQCGLPFSADLVLISSFYFLLGHFLARHAKEFRPNTWFVALAGITFVSLLLVFNYTIILNFRLYQGLVVSTVQAIAAIYLVLSLCYWLTRIDSTRRVLAYIGSGSLFVLLFHYVLQEKVFSLLAHYIAPGWTVSLSSLVLSVAVSLTLWEIAKRSPILSRLLLPIRTAPVVEPAAATRSAPTGSTII